MMELNKRSLILGIGTLIATPAIVKIDSLMHLRGESLDPLVLGVRASNSNLYHESIFNNKSAAKNWTMEIPGLMNVSIYKKAKILNDKYSNPGFWGLGFPRPIYEVIRQSELYEL